MSRLSISFATAAAVSGFSIVWVVPAQATTRTADAVRRCGEQTGCKVIHENNGDVVIFVDDVDGDGKGSGVIRCPASTGTCTSMIKRHPQSTTAPHKPLAVHR